jgi:rRNA maturation endonuclease Nob1
LFNRKFSVRRLNRLADEGVLKVPTRVANELRKERDKVGLWVESHRECWIRETAENMKEFDRVVRVYGSLLTETSSAADPTVVALGVYFRDSRTVVSDDAGIQVACAHEGLICLPLPAFMKLVGL